MVVHLTDSTVPKAEDLEWERNEQYNVGLDFSFFNGRLAFNVDWYNKLSKKVLFEIVQPDHMGFSSLLTNSGEIRNRGIEMTVSADPVNNKDFSWHTDLTLSHNEGVFTKIPTQTHRQQQAGQFQNQLFQMIEGENSELSGVCTATVYGRKTKLTHCSLMLTVRTS